LESFQNVGVMKGGTVFEYLANVDQPTIVSMNQEFSLNCVMYRIPPDRATKVVGKMRLPCRGGMSL
jgi:hypothetical protein